MCDVVLEAYDGLKIVAWPPEAPFYFYGGDTSEKVPTGEVDGEGNPVYKTVFTGVVL